jgi:isocitrate/isopropylmalate dehydrogenase
VGAVGVRNSNHFGTAAYFTRMAPPAGAIAILTTNASAAMAPWGADGSGKSARIPGQSPLRPAGTASRMTDTLLMTRAGVERVVRFAFELAGNRSGAPADGVSRVTCVDKSYVLRSYAFFRAVFDEVALE